MSFTLTPQSSLKKVDYSSSKETEGDILNENWDLLDSLFVPVGTFIPWHKTFNSTRYESCAFQTLPYYPPCSLWGQGMYGYGLY